jgi:PAS domain S-box-containing protein
MVIDSIQDAIMIFDESGKYLIKNKPAERLYGNINCEFISDCLNYEIQLYDHKGTRLNKNNIPSQKVIEGETVNNYDMTIKYPDGSVCFVSINGMPIYNQSGEFLYGLLVCRVVTESIRTKQQLVEQADIILSQKKQLETIIEHIPEAFTVYDRNANLILKNAAARRLYPSQEILKNAGAFFNAFQYHDMSGKAIKIENLPYRRTLRGETVKDELIVIKRKNKDQITQITTAPIFDNDRRITSFISFHRDITEAKEKERLYLLQQEQLLKTEMEKNQALNETLKMKDEFVSLVSHEFKTPLAVILSAIQTMELICKNELSSKAMRYIGKIKQNTYRQMRLVNNLLDITRMNSGNVKLNKNNFDIVFLTNAIVSSVQLFAIQRGIDLKFTTKMKSHIIGIDDEKYERVLLNLLSNAIKFTPAGKSVVVQLRKYRGQIVLAVTDEGIGIPKDKRKIIFERFGQVDSSLSRYSEGTGIGLSLVKNIVTALNGRVSVQSKIGMGSTFKVMLPDERVNENKSNIDHEEVFNNRLLSEISVQFSDIYFENDVYLEDDYKNLHSRIYNLIEREKVVKLISHELNNCINLEGSLNAVIGILKQFLGCQAVGIRLHNNNDFNYYVHDGFPETFIQMENKLCDNGKCNKKTLHCICGRVLSNETDPELDFYTRGGSFWTNSSSSLLTLESEIKKFARFRGTCIKSGFESFALVPIKAGTELLGLIQVCEAHKNKFTLDTVEYLEMVAEQIGLAVAVSNLQN